jgi:CHAT domain-containing protein/tetratricopeptide (TPR) repeat protein
LTRPFDKHLDSDELDLLVSSHSASVTDAGQLSEHALGEVQHHVESCQDCNRKVQMHKSVQSEIVRLGAPSRVPPGPDCVRYVEWLNVAAGLFPEAKTKEFMKHATQCGHCGPLLRNAAETISDEATPHEEEMLATLGSAGTDWQRDMAETLRRSIQGRQRRTEGISWRQELFSSPRPAFAIAALAAVVVVGWLGVRALRPPSAEQLIAQAYTEHRTLEVRISGAQYAPIRVERSTGGSSIDKSPALLKAEALIGENLRKNPNDPEWLQAKAQADLLDGNYSSAITSLQRALETQQDAPGLQTDLASAYFLQGLSEARPSDYTLAIDLLGRVLQQQPDNKIALFNRAIVLERMFLFSQAVEDWEQYLRLDPSGAWSKEASERLQRLKLRQQTHEKASREPLMEPDQLLEQVDRRVETTWKPVDRRIEEYEHLVVRDWLRRAFPASSEGRHNATGSETERALQLIATISRVRHADNWLNQLLTASMLPEFSNAISALSNAVAASEQADYVRALNESRRAQQLFLRMDNPAGLSRAQFEEVFALHFSNNAPECAKHAAQLANEATRNHFAWIALQTQIELGICRNSEGDYGGAKDILASAGTSAQSFAYPITQMRALTMGGLVAWSEGNGSDAWSDLKAGLDRCWIDYCPAMTIYSLYANMDNFAEDSRQWYLQVLLVKQALLALGDDPDHLMRAVEHNRLAKAAMLAHMPSLAREQFAIANQLLDSVPQTDVTRNYRAGIQIDLAKLASEEGDSDAAFRYLAAVGPQTPRIADHYLLADYYQTLGHLQLKSHRIDKARESLQWAIAFAEKQLSSLRSEHERLAWRQLSGSTYRDLVELELESGQQQSALGIWEWYLGVPLRSGPGLKANTSDAAENDVFFLNQTGQKAPHLPALKLATQTIQSFHDSTLISFAILSGRTAVWVSDDRGIFFSWIEGDASDLALLARRFKRLCADRDADTTVLRAESKQLYASMLAPIALHFLAERTLVFEGDSELVDIPLQALVDERGNYLADEFSVTTLPGIYYMSRLRATSAISADDPLLVVAAPTGKHGPGPSYPLPDVLEEASEVVGKFHNAQLLTGNRLNERSLRAGFRGAVLFHFAGHASAGQTNSGLIFAGLPSDEGGSLWDATRILSLRPDRAQLAVMSACSTEGSSEKGLEDPDSLALAFLDAGVPHIVASRWNVDSATTVKFMASFYDALLSGKSVPQSVRQAGIRIRSLPGAQRPYYWAAFSSFGTS